MKIHTHIPDWLLCSVLLSLTWVSAQAQFLIDKRITIQPIQVRSNDGSTSVSNPSLTLFEAATDKIWAQAGIDALFLDPITYNNSLFLTTSTTLGAANSVYALENSGSGGGNPTVQSWSLPTYGGTLSANTVRLFFVQSLGSGVTGFAIPSELTAGNPSGVIVDQHVFMAVSDLAFPNRTDVVAHELGHLLGMEGTHDTIGAGNANPNNLMTAGQYRNSPDAGNFMNIYPGGLGYDRLTGIISLGNPDWRTEQIDRARNLPFAMDLPLNQQYIYGAVPEPATTTAIAGSIMLAAAGFIRRRRRATTVTKTASV